VYVEQKKASQKIPGTVLTFVSVGRAKKKQHGE
jgi:hypothetical protein